MIRVKRLNPDAKLPTRSHSSAGYDLYACEGLIIPVGATAVVPTGIAVEFPPGHVALIWDRSGLGAKGIHRFAGVIDSDYRGPWGVVLHNASGVPYKIEVGDRIAQVLFQEVQSWPVEEAVELSDTARGEGGFGSTGR
jgi:dUTP pyrophosphatase